MHVRNDIKQSRKRGFGIMEVMVAALVLGLLYAAVCQLQKGNREALLRIRGRDGATEIAQNVIDDLSARGLASLTDANLTHNEDGTWSLPQQNIVREWDGQPGTVSYTIRIPYTVDVTVSGDDEYRASSASLLNANGPSHVYAKRVDVKVSWPYKGTNQSISVSGVIR
jgi:type II secretory pathway pseudopilin PulG